MLSKFDDHSGVWEYNSGRVLQRGYLSSPIAHFLYFISLILQFRFLGSHFLLQPFRFVSLHSCLLYSTHFDSPFFFFSHSSSLTPSFESVKYLILHFFFQLSFLTPYASTSHKPYPTCSTPTATSAVLGLVDGPTPVLFVPVR